MFACVFSQLSNEGQETLIKQCSSAIKHLADYGGHSPLLAMLSQVVSSSEIIQLTTMCFTLTPLVFLKRLLSFECIAHLYLAILLWSAHEYLDSDVLLWYDFIWCVFVPLRWNYMLYLNKGTMTLLSVCVPGQRRTIRHEKSFVWKQKQSYFSVERILLFL